MLVGGRSEFRKFGPVDMTFPKCPDFNFPFQVQAVLKPETQSTDKT